MKRDRAGWRIAYLDDYHRVDEVKDCGENVLPAEVRIY
jgi:hypothetical protein